MSPSKISYIIDKKNFYILHHNLVYRLFFTDTEAAEASDLKDATLDELLQAAGN